MTLPKFIELTDYQDYINEIGTPASAPKPRGISPGRRPGVTVAPRKTLKVTFKSNKEVINQAKSF